MILALARHIFEHGTDGRFYSQVRKYHHEGGKVYWSMDSTPKATGLINRCDEAQTSGGAPCSRHSSKEVVSCPTRVSLLALPAA